MKLPIYFASALLLLLAGCASPQLQGDRVVQVYSEPPGARVVLATEDGTAVWTGETPAPMPLKCAIGRYKVSFEKPGYYPSGTSIDGTIGGWYYGDFTTGPPAVNAYIEPSTDAHWSPLPPQLIWTLVPEEIKLGTKDMQVLERIENPY